MYFVRCFALTKDAARTHIKIAMTIGNMLKLI